MSVMPSHLTVPPIANGPSAKWSYLSLIYSFFYFFPLHANWDYYSSIDVVLTLVCFVVFVALFIQSTRVAGKQALLPVAGIILVCVWTSSFHTGANALFGYAAFLASYYFRMRTATLYFVANITAQLTTAISFNLWDLYYLGPSMGVTVSLFLFGRFSHKECLFNIVKEEKNKQIEQLSAIAERERIARDMHDLLGHSLSSLALKSELAQKLIANGSTDQAMAEIEQVATLARSTLSEVRAAVTGMKQTGLLAILKSLCEQLEHLGFNTRLNVALIALDAKTESTLIMLCKEWITNILRHSKGDSVAIDLSQDAKRIRLHIDDNGQVDRIRPGNGIEGMQSRIRELQGEWELSTSDGVKLAVVLPLLN